MSARVDTSRDRQSANKAAALRFIHGFNDDDWDEVRAVVTPGFVFHHPLGGTVVAGPEGMVSTWAGFKQLSPDSWHPVPVMIAEGDYVAVLLPTYGHFTGQGEHAPPPTGGRLDYGMVNMVRLTGGKLSEMWFGMDSLVEMQQMGIAPPTEPRRLSPAAQTNLDAFHDLVATEGEAFDNVAAFDEAVVAMGPPQAEKTTTTRRLDVYRFDDGEATLVYTHELTTDPPHDGGQNENTQVSRALIGRWIDEVVNRHETGSIDAIASPHLLVHPTAMPCESAHYSAVGARNWLGEQWDAFADLAFRDHFVIAQGDIVAVRWGAAGISRGDFMGVPPTGEMVEFTGVSMFRVEAGKIAEIWDTRNTLGILHQLDPDLGAGGHHH